MQVHCLNLFLSFFVDDGVAAPFQGQNFNWLFQLFSSQTIPISLYFNFTNANFSNLRVTIKPNSYIIMEKNMYKLLDKEGNAMHWLNMS